MNRLPCQEKRCFYVLQCDFIRRMMTEITDDAGYKEVMVRIEGLMAKGSEAVSKEELAEISLLTQMAQAYEQDRYMI
ncbi:hypothetical protein EON73_04895 [bacterium]|nr:MAG: hypothetical protein EON73_04895 [bacterium]